MSNVTQMYATHTSKKRTSESYLMRTKYAAHIEHPYRTHPYACLVTPI